MFRVNPFILRGERGSGSHVVILTAIDKGGATVHDPGLPPQKNLRVSLGRLKKAMYGNDTLLIAIRKRER